MRQLSNRSRFLCAAIAALGLCSFSQNNAQAATQQYFDVNGTTSGFGITNGATYSWESAFWATPSPPTNGTDPNGTIATGNFIQDGTGFARFYGGSSGNTYTVTVGQSEPIAGMFLNATGVTLNVNSSGSGTLNVSSGDQGFLVPSGESLIVNAVLSGAGGVAPEGLTSTSAGSFYLYGNNTYTGGTTIGYSGSPLVYFNNSHSFGTGPIGNNFTSASAFAALCASGGTTITLPNAFKITTTGQSTAYTRGFNFAGAANTPVVSNGTWTLGINTLVLRSSGGATSPVSLTNTISGTGGVILSANNGANSITFSGTNTYTGATTITGPGGTGAGSGTIRLILGAANTIASSSSVALAGGILDADGFTHNMGSTTLALLTSTSASTIDMSAGASEIDFANSSAVSWTGTTLNLTNWNPAVDKLRFGTDNTGLSSDQLAKIEFNGAGLGTASLDANGFVVVPEPASLSLLGLGGLAILARRRRA